MVSPIKLSACLQSLSTCLTHLNDTETPRLIEAAVGAHVTLIMLTTEVGSSEQFDQLCALLGEGIIHGIWLHASDRPDVILASLKALPPLLRALKIGNARFMKVKFCIRGKVVKLIRHSPGTYRAAVTPTKAQIGKSLAGGHPDSFT